MQKRPSPPSDQERIYLSPPDVGHLERSFVEAAIASNWVAPIGPDLTAFEADISTTCNRQWAVGVSSGTAGLHLCLHALGVGPGDSVLVSSFTFAATANAVAYTGATPTFVDCDRETWNVDPELVRQACKEAQRTGVTVKALVAVDLYGQCCDYPRLLDVCDEFGVTIISDAAESLGARAYGRAAGSFGLAAVFSFNGNKIITTSGGGMVVTDDLRFAERIRKLATQSREPAVHYEHIELGFNYRLSNLLAAFGRGQISTLQERVDKRRAINQRYREALNDLPLSFAPVPSWSEPNCWLSCIVLERGYEDTCEIIRKALEAINIESRPLWKPMHMQPLYKECTAIGGTVSEDLFNRGLCLPSGSALTLEQQAQISGAIISAV